MEKKINIFGIGPKLTLSSIPYLIIVTAILAIYPDLLRMDFLPPKIAIGIGLLFAAVGIIFYIISVITLFTLFKEGKLIQSRTFALCRNPIYASFIVFFVPAAAFLTRSWLVLSASVVIYVLFKIFIPKETEYLERTFGDEYRQYAAKVNEVIPFPRFSRDHK